MKKLLLLSILFLLILSGCKPKQQLADTKPAVLKGTTGQIIEKIRQAEPKFQTANFSKISLSLNTKDRSFNLSATCKMVKDSAIHLSALMPFLGTEMFKVEFTTANIRVFDKMNNSFYEADYNLITEMSGVAVDFFAIQALFSNTFFTLASPLPCNNCKTENSQIIFEKSGIKQSVAINNLFRIISVNLTKENQNQNLFAEYKDFTATGKSNFLFPQQIKITAGNETSQSNLILNISKMEFDGNVSLNPLNTVTYKRGNINNLLRMMR